MTTPSIDSGNPDNSSPPGFKWWHENLSIANISDNPVFLETEKLIARCIQRTNETELETSEKDFEESNETELDIEAEVVAATKMKVFLQLSVVYSFHDIYLVIIRIMLTLTSWCQHQSPPVPLQHHQRVESTHQWEILMYTKLNN